MKKDDYIEYINFIYGVVRSMIDIIGTDIEGRINDFKTSYIKRIKPNDSPEYQYRIGGYIAERLTNVFINKKFTKIKEYKTIITERKY